GASGSGKSSLVNAGIVPKLFVPRRVPGSAFLRRIVFRPGETREDEDIFSALARAFAVSNGSDVGLPELIGPDQTLDDLASRSRQGGDRPAYPIALALARVGEDAVKHARMLDFEKPKVVLAVDQLEELFSSKRFSHETRCAFVHLLSGLAGSGSV